jgi:hypothetical protein
LFSSSALRQKKIKSKINHRIETINHLVIEYIENSYKLLIKSQKKLERVSKINL